MCGNPLPVASAGYIPYPLFILKVPANGLANTIFKCGLRRPSELALNLARIHGITAVVSRAVLHKRDQIPAGTCHARRHLIHEVADDLHDFEVWLFIPATNVVRLSGLPALQDGCDGLAVILYVKAGADGLAVSIHWHGPSFARIENHQRNQLLR